MTMNPICSLLSLVIATTILGACPSPSAALCARIAECSDDTGDDSDDGADDVAVCTETQSGLLTALRANAEPECDALAQAIDGMNACRGALDCEDFNDEDDGGQCDGQADALADACDDIADGDIDCESLLAFQCGFGG